MHKPLALRLPIFVSLEGCLAAPGWRVVAWTRALVSGPVRLPPAPPEAFLTAGIEFGKRPLLVRGLFVDECTVMESAQVISGLGAGPDPSSWAFRLPAAGKNASLNR